MILAIRRVFLGLFAFLAVGRGESLTIATYNVENYTLADRMTPAGYRPAYPKPEAAKVALRTVLRDLDADVVALQEIGGRAFLEELRRDLAREGLVYPHAEILEADEEPRHVAVLSRRPLTKVRRHTDLDFRYFDARMPVKRGLLEVGLDTPDGELTLFMVHLKSRYTDRRDDPRSSMRRAGEAVAVRDRILQRFAEPAGARFLIVGDFNDSPVARPLRALLARGRTAISELLPAADSRGETWTHRYQREDSYTRVDHVLISPHPELRAAVRAGKARIYDGPAAMAASDHRPVTVTLVWSQPEPEAGLPSR